MNQNVSKTFVIQNFHDLKKAAVFNVYSLITAASLRNYWNSNHHNLIIRRLLLKKKKEHKLMRMCCFSTYQNIFYVLTILLESKICPKF